MTRLTRTLTIAVAVCLVATLGGSAYLLLGARGSSHPRHVSIRTPQVTSTTASPSTTTTLPPPVPTTIRPPTPATPATTAPRPTVPTVPVPPQVLLTNRLNTALAGTDSCLVVSDDKGNTVYQRNPDTALLPASTQKLLVAETALDVLGPNYRFTTTVVAPAAPVNGQVESLWLVGGGDPMLAAPDFIAATSGQARYAGLPWTPLTSLATSLATAGITSVPGGIHGDASYQNGPGWLPTWPAVFQQPSVVGILSALSINEGAQFTGSLKTSPDAADPPAYAASALAGLLTQRGTAIGVAADAAAPAASVTVATVTSAPLSQIVAAMLRASDNWIAELLTRAIDKASGGTGTTAGGVAVVLRHATQTGIPMTAAAMDDGSGLSRTDRATCTELLATLDLGYQPAYAAVLDGLAVAGQSGSLADRFNGTPIAGRLRAKTGTLAGVAGLVGLEDVASPVRFAYLDNDNRTEAELESTENAFVNILAGYRG